MRSGLTHNVGWAERTREPHQNWQRFSMVGLASFGPPCGRLAMLAAFVAGLSFGLSANALAQAKPNESLDRELMRDLGGDAHDVLDRDRLDSETSKHSQPTPNAKLQERLRDDTSPRGNVARRMHDAATLLEKGNGGRMTQYLQEEVLTDLDTMIKQARQSGQKSDTTTQQTAGRTPSGQTAKPPDGQGGGKPNEKPVTGSSQRDASTPSHKVDPEQLQAMMKRVWGDLPQRAREQVMQLPSEAFPPHYETLIEDYFRRLSESEQSGGGPQR